MDLAPDDARESRGLLLTVAGEAFAYYARRSLGLFDGAVLAATSTASAERGRVRHPHPVWDEMARLDFAGEARDLEGWFRGRLPIAARVQVLWVAPWDVEDGFDLRGSGSWSGDPEDWEWWYSDDYEGGRYELSVLPLAREMARSADTGEPLLDVVSNLTTWVVVIGVLSLAAMAAMERLDPTSVLGGQDELWLVAGYPDALYGIILGRVTPAGFERYDNP